MFVERRQVASIALLLVLCGVGQTRAAETVVEPLNSERPTFIDSASVVGRGRYQIEIGVERFRLDDESIVSFGSPLLRIGTGRATELRVGLPDYTWDRFEGTTDRGFGDLLLGFKRLLKRSTRPGAPAVAVIVETIQPTGARSVGEPHGQYFATLVLTWELTPRLELTANVAASRPCFHSVSYAQFAAGAVLTYQLTSALSVFTESYVLAPEKPASRSCEHVAAGAQWAITRDLSVDAMCTVGLGDARPDDDLTVGLCRRW